MLRLHGPKNVVRSNFALNPLRGLIPRNITFQIMERQGFSCLAASSVLRGTGQGTCERQGLRALVSSVGCVARSTEAATPKVSLKARICECRAKNLSFGYDQVATGLGSQARKGLRQTKAPGGDGLMPRLPERINLVRVLHSYPEVIRLGANVRAFLG